MGVFLYENGPKIEIEDRALTHLQLVMTSKLRRGEPFTFSWKDDTSVGGGRTSVWIHSRSSLTFKYSNSRTHAINRSWADALALMASSPSGLYMIPEPARKPDAAPPVQSVSV